MLRLSIFCLREAHGSFVYGVFQDDQLMVDFHAEMSSENVSNIYNRPAASNDNWCSRLVMLSLWCSFASRMDYCNAVFYGVTKKTILHQSNKYVRPTSNRMCTSGTNFRAAQCGDVVVTDTNFRCSRSSMFPRCRTGQLQCSASIRPPSVEDCSVPSFPSNLRMSAASGKGEGNQLSCYQPADESENHEPR